MATKLPPPVEVMRERLKNPVLMVWSEDMSACLAAMDVMWRTIVFYGEAYPLRIGESARVAKAKVEAMK